MLGKLLKYEFIYLVKDFTRTYIIYGAEVLVFTILIAISGHGSAYGTLLGIFAVIYYIFTLVLALLTISHNVRRFKKNMFSHEGYLTNTLPVTPAQHVIAKVIVGAVNYMISFLVIYLGMLILSAGSGNAGEFRRIMDFSFKLLDKFDKERCARCPDNHRIHHADYADLIVDAKHRYFGTGHHVYFFANLSDMRRHRVRCGDQHYQKQTQSAMIRTGRITDAKALLQMQSLLLYNY